MKLVMKLTPFAARSAGALLAALVGGDVLAGPFLREQVPADVKWVLHLDLDNFRSTQVGDCLVKGKLEKDMAKARADLKTYLDFDFDWTRIGSLTAYGMDFASRGKAHGVLLLQTSMDVQQGLETAISKQAQAGVDGNVRKLQDAPVPIYSVREEMFVALPPGKPVVVAKTEDLLNRGLAVLAGQGANLASTQAFLDFPPAPKGFVFLAMAAGFADQAPIPPQAQILKMTDAGQLAMGETGDRMFLTATLKAKTAEIGGQMEQVIRGLMALGALGQPQNQDWQQLIQSTRVSVRDRMVTVGLELPVLTVVQKIQAKQNP